MSNDKYQNFTELSSNEVEGQDFNIELDNTASDVIIIAPHGGSIEPGTSELAKAIAHNQFSLALFEGTKSTGNQDLHITSSRFDEPRFCELVAAHSLVIALHGEKSRRNTVYMGGKDTELANRIDQSLSASGFEVATHQNPQLQGRSSNNICNKGTTGQGVQLEIAAGLRRQMFESLNRQGRATTTDIFDKFVKAVQQAITTFTN